MNRSATSARPIGTRSASYPRQTTPLNILLCMSSTARVVGFDDELGVREQIPSNIGEGE